jgi:putative peptidoglycan lipid II flippase
MNPMQSSQSTSKANRQIARAAGILMVTFVLAKLVGLAASMLLARRFGAGTDYDAYLAANRFSDTLFNLVAGGALASAFIPTFTTLLARSNPGGAWRLASAMANLVLLVLTGLGVLGAVFAPWVVRTLLAPGFTDPAQQALTVELLRIQVASSVIFGVSGLLMGILNAHQRFFLPALAPALYPLGVIFGTLALGPQMGIRGAAWGVVIGAALHLLVQVPHLVRLPERRYIPSLGLRLPEVREVLLLMAPRLIGVAVVQLNFLINTQIASGLPAGSLVAIQLGFMVMMMPQAAIAQSIAIAALPTFSAQVAQGRPEEMRVSLAASLRGVLLLSIPASIGLILLRRPLVALLFQGGMFTEDSVNMAAWALLWYAAGLVGHCVVEITSRAFYALHDTRTPVVVGVSAMTLNIIFSLLFSRWFGQAGLQPHGGLALANSLATALEMVVLLALMGRQLGGLHSAQGLRAALAAGGASLGMAAVIVVWMQFSGQQGTSPVASAIVTAGGIGLGGLAYGALLAAFRVPEVQQGWGLVAARLKR